MTTTTLSPILHPPTTAGIECLKRMTDPIVPTDAQWFPVFVDPTGRRHRLMQIATSVLALTAATPMVIAGAAMLPL